MTKIYYFYQSHFLSHLSCDKETKLKLDWRLFFSFVQVSIKKRKKQKTKQSGTLVLSTWGGKHTVNHKCCQTFFLDSNKVTKCQECEQNTETVFWTSIKYFSSNAFLDFGVPQRLVSNLYQLESAWQSRSWLPFNTNTSLAGFIVTVFILVVFAVVAVLLLTLPIIRTL